MKLIKKYRLVWKEKRILIIGEFDLNSETGIGANSNGYDSDESVDILNKVDELGLDKENQEYYDFVQKLKS